MCLHYTFLIFLNTARESDKSYMINHIAHFGLKAMIRVRVRIYEIDTLKKYFSDERWNVFFYPANAKNLISFKLQVLPRW